MNRCIKCGKEIPDGELFCLECSLNPGSSMFEEEVEKRPAPKGRMQTPQPVKRPAPQAAAAVKAEKAASGKGPRRALVIVTLLLLASLGFIFWQYGDLQVERTRLKTKEADMLLREKDAEELQLQVDDLNSQVAQLTDTISQKEQEIKDLQKQLSGSQSSQSQSEYDLSTSQAEVERLQDENEQLLLLEQDLKDEIQSLTQNVQELDAALQDADRYKVKATFMDNYVVFVENNGSGVYHTYDCANFTKSNFWAYSRKLAESSGYKPCPVCGGKAS